MKQNLYQPLLFFHPTIEAGGGRGEGAGPGLVRYGKSGLGVSEDQEMEDSLSEFTDVIPCMWIVGQGLWLYRGLKYPRILWNTTVLFKGLKISKRDG